MFRLTIEVPNRQGVVLRGLHYAPDSSPAPTVLSLTPYGADRFHRDGMLFASRGFHFVSLDVRGRGDSDGRFTPFVVDGIDGHDAVEWLAERPWSSGDVVLYGGSYGGFVQWAVVHELATDRIVAIWNGFSGRKVGDPALLDDLPDPLPPGGVYGPYEKVLVDGRRISSVSAIVADADGVACGLLCVNLDRSPLDGVVELLSAFAAPVQPRPPELFTRAWHEQIALAVDHECRERGLRRDMLTRADRKAIVASVDAQGLFATRHAAGHVARALSTSRATVYMLLKEIRADRDDG